MTDTIQDDRQLDLMTHYLDYILSKDFDNLSPRERADYLNAIPKLENDNG